MYLPSQKLINTNIFLLIESYLSDPSYALAEQIKNLSHSLTNEAYEEAIPERIRNTSWFETTAR